MGKMLKNQDGVAPTISTDIHLDYDVGQRTHVGGVFTIIAKLLLLAVIYLGGHKMVYRINPYLQSTEMTIGPE